jgi:hypothetical protein
MKRIITLLTMVLAFQQTIFAQEDNPVNYLQQFSKINTTINEKYLSYISGASHGKSAKKVEKRRQQLLKEIGEAASKVEMLPYFKGDKKFWETSRDYYVLLNKVFNDDFTSIINMEEVAEQSYDAMEAYLLAKELASQKLDEAQKKLNDAEKLFAKENNVNLIESSSDLGNKLEQSNKVNQYHKVIYLVFFKCYKQDQYVSDAIQAQQINALEQSTSSLLSFANEGLAKLATLSTFNGDNSLLEAAKAALTYYKNQAEKVVPNITSFMLKKELFEKLKNEMEAKGNARTNKDIEEYNKQVAALNAGVATYNTLSKEITKTKNDMLNNWNKAETAFFHTYMPYKG